MSTANVINQKEYLKKYLNIGKDKDKKRKKKKKAKATQNGLKIIDDNIDVINTEETLTQNELDEFLTQEDAPQVVGVVDDRPLALRLDDYRKNSKWKLVGSDDESKPTSSSSNHVSRKSSDQEKNSKYKNYDSDASPPRKRNRNSDSDPSPPRRGKNERKSPDSDVSPPRKNRTSETSPHRIKKEDRSDSDVSPPRKHLNRSPSRRKRSPDLSPPRRKMNYDSDASPPRKKSNQSPPRKNRSPDLSPQRRKRSERDSSPPRKNSSPDNRRKIGKYNLEHKKSERGKKSRWGEWSPEKPNLEEDLSPPRHKPDQNEERIKPKHSKTRDFSEPGSSKMEKTLDGKAAGLQNAKDLKHETQAFKKREEALFKKMSQEVSGINAAPVIRDRKTGKKRDFEQEQMEEFAKLKKDKEQKEKYDKWGKGLKQVENMREKIESDLHEMSKPLARYADDEDLERHLKEQERDGDPMLAYFRKKRKKQAVVEGRPIKPMYEGEFMPNRFGVPPGHRWDGVDRSNGYEKQWFSKQNAKKAMEEEIYKWSTEDM